MIPIRRTWRLRLGAICLVAAGLASGCQPSTAGPTPPIVAGSSSAPREVNLIARDYTFVPSVLELVPGETILLHVVNAGLVVHEAILGAMVVQSGERVDLTWTVPLDVAGPAGSTDVRPAWLVGCHIPGHWAKGMQIPIRWVDPAASGAPSAAR